MKKGRYPGSNCVKAYYYKKLPAVAFKMIDEKTNTWHARIKRLVTSFFPIAKNRKGKCIDCGECCKLPNICPFLKVDEKIKYYCSIYSIRILNCRKYPRTKDE